MVVVLIIRNVVHAYWERFLRIHMYMYMYSKIFTVSLPIFFFWTLRAIIFALLAFSLSTVHCNYRWRGITKALGSTYLRCNASCIIRLSNIIIAMLHTAVQFCNHVRPQFSLEEGRSCSLGNPWPYLHLMWFQTINCGKRMHISRNPRCRLCSQTYMETCCSVQCRLNLCC